MKTTNLLIIGVILVILLVALLVYLLLFSGQRSPVNFADLNIGGQIDDTVVTPPETPEEIAEPVVNLDRPRLRQLTTRPTIGFVETQATSTEPLFIKYMEAGSGNIFKINLDSGEETRLTNTTIPMAHLARFSPDGTTVAVRSRNDRRAGELTVAKIPNEPGGLEIKNTLDSVYDFTVFSSTTIAYTERTAHGMRASSYSLVRGNTTTLFTIPFFEATIAWGNRPSAAHVVYPRPSHALGGYLYTFTNGRMSRLPASGFGFTALNTENFIVYTETTNFKPKTYIYNKETRTRNEFPLVLLPEKCTPDLSDVNTIWCGNEETTLPLEFPDLWYKGVLSFKDSLWQIDLASLSAFHIVDTLAESGREIDIVDIAAGASGTAIYFINKNDNTLWMYEI